MRSRPGLVRVQLDLGIMDVLKHVYESEQRFQLRDDRPAYLVKKCPGTGLVEAVFGLYPSDRPSSYFAHAYGDASIPRSSRGPRIPRPRSTWMALLPLSD